MSDCDQRNFFCSNDCLRKTRYWPDSALQLDGNTFYNDGPSVDKELLVGEGRLGLAMTCGDIRFGYTHVFRSREFEGQTPQDFGSISLSLMF
ncbi:MAG: lipid A deacylase LpxR family protein [Alphaproteobacteria bacterium]|nr:lipid A deacylase LpxR family protein [Alphaproteobacteria bacterium]